MKILHIIHRFFPSEGGAETHLLNLSKKLVEKGHNVSILTANAVGSTAPIAETSIKSKLFRMRSSDLLSYEKLFGIDIYRVPYFYLPYYNVIMPKVFSHLIKQDFDVVHLHGYSFWHSDFPSIILRMKNVPYVFTAHGFHKLVTFTSFKRRIIKNIYDFSIGAFVAKGATKIIALSEDDVKEFQKLGCNSEKMVIVPHGVDIEKFSSIKNGNDFQRKFGISGRIVLFVGRLEERKGLEYAIDAAYDVIKEFNDVKFVIIGRDWTGYRKKLNKLIKTKKMGKYFHFLGYVNDNDLIQAFNSSEFFILPSLYEGQGIVLLEAMAAKKPVIATNVGGIPKIVKHGYNGLLISPENSTELSESILNLLKDNALKVKMGLNGYNLVKREFSWDKMTDQIEQVYLEALSHKI